MSEIVSGPIRSRFDNHEMRDAKARTTEWVSDKIDVTARAVCGVCNTGWLSDLETRAAPLLTPMIRDGEPTVIDYLSQFRIATWATKTAMLFEYVSADATPYYTPAQRTELMTDLIPQRE